ncbi:MAG TPA: fibronectin type III-like domain-contianing protein, partial [Dermatophilaceae bacterium]
TVRAHAAMQPGFGSGMRDQRRVKAFGTKGASAVVSLPVTAGDLGVWDVTRDLFVTEPGSYGVHAGRSCTDLPLRADLEILGEPVPPRAARGRAQRAADFDDAQDIEIAERTRETGDAVQVAARASVGWVVLRNVDARGATRGILTLARTRGGPAHVRVEVTGAHGGWVSAATAQAPTAGGRHDWSEVAIQPGPSWERLFADVVDVRLVLDGAVRVGELFLA